MAEIGVRELKERASEIVRRVREQRARYIITYRGRPVAVVAPLGDAPLTNLPPAEEVENAWDELDRLGEEIGSGWRSPLTSTEILAETRR